MEETPFARDQYPGTGVERWVHGDSRGDDTVARRQSVAGQVVDGPTAGGSDDGDSAPGSTAS
jgi:hypothetical protein